MNYKDALERFVGVSRQMADNTRDFKCECRAAWKAFINGLTFCENNLQNEISKKGGRALSNEKALFTWYGKSNTELSREELLKIIQHLNHNIDAARNESIRQLNMIRSFSNNNNALNRQNKKNKEA